MFLLLLEGMFDLGGVQRIVMIFGESYVGSSGPWPHRAWIAPSECIS